MLKRKEVTMREIQWSDINPDNANTLVKSKYWHGDEFIRMDKDSFSNCMP